MANRITPEEYSSAIRMADYFSTGGTATTVKTIKEIGGSQLLVVMEDRLRFIKNN